MPVVVAHRGASAFAPEHTIAAYDLAVAAGADYIEQDLQLTADGELIVLHDETLDRTTGGTCRGRVSKMTSADLAACDVGSWFNSRFPDRARNEFAALRIPKLAEIFARYSGRTRFYVETKNPAEAPGMEEKLVALIDHFGPGLGADSAPSLLRPAVLPDIILQSFSGDSLRLLRSLSPRIPRVRLLEAGVTPEQIIAQLEEITDYAHAIGPAYTSVDRDVVAAAHARGLAVHPYTVNAEDVMHRLMALGVDAMFTDDPALLLSLRRSLDNR